MVREAMVGVYERRLARALAGADIPRHVGVIVDGNRRWARATGFHDVTAGPRRGADKITDLLQWCDEAGVEVVTLFLLSTDNLSRPEPELVPLLRIIEGVAEDLSRPRRPWRAPPPPRAARASCAPSAPSSCCRPRRSPSSSRRRRRRTTAAVPRSTWRSG